MVRGPAGGPGHPAHQAGRLGQEPVLILHLKEVERPASAPPLRINAVRVPFPSESDALKC